MRKVLTTGNIQKQKIVRIPFTGAWKDAFGNPQDRGIWFVWGTSGSGKSTFLMALAKAFALTGKKVLYNVLEEEPDDADYIDRTKLLNLQEVGDHFVTASYDEMQLNTYLKKRSSADVIIIDSLPYFMSRMDEDYKPFKTKWSSKKIIIFSGHAKGQNPTTDFQTRVMFDAKMKIYVSGYLATCKGRTIGKKGHYIIWEDGYNRLQGQNAHQNE